MFGRPAGDVGLLAFTASTNRIRAGQSATLSWRSEDMHRLDLHPGIGSVGAFTDAYGVREHAGFPGGLRRVLACGEQPQRRPGEGADGPGR